MVFIMSKVGSLTLIFGRICIHAYLVSVFYPCLLLSSHVTLIIFFLFFFFFLDDYLGPGLGSYY
jgi:hypothetical protein